MRIPAAVLPSVCAILGAAALGTLGVTAAQAQVPPPAALPPPPPPPPGYGPNDRTHDARDEQIRADEAYERAVERWAAEMLNGYQSIEVDFVADNPGRTLFHCHQQLHMDFGFRCLFDYV